MEQLNGFELAGRSIRVSTVEENEPATTIIKQEEQPTVSIKQENVQVDETNSTSRLQLIANLAKSRSDVEVPKVTQEAIAAQQAHKQNVDNIPSFATQCFMLSNMFDLAKETEPGWDLDIRDDVVEECRNHGGFLKIISIKGLKHFLKGCVHVYVDKASQQGNVYVKCPTVAIAHKSVVALHGRWFAGY